MSNPPPFTITPTIIHQIARIGEQLGQYSSKTQDMQNVRLRRIHRIRTIHGSLAIEGNTLSEEQITAILEGKPVIAPPREIQEARNAIEVYEQLGQWHPSKSEHLLSAHQLLMKGLIEDAGQYRTGNVGVMNGEQVIHMAPQADRVRKLMEQLLSWLDTTEQHALISSSVFHYEFEFIHPFADGNGRMGRLWQSLILSRWNPLFAHFPIESMIHTHQNAYYQAINQSTQQTDSAPFIEFMLQMVLDTLSGTTPQEKPQVTPQVKKLLESLQGEMSRDELQLVLQLKDRKSFRARYLLPALEEGWIEMTIPDKPNSRLQQYKLTPSGKSLKQQLAF